jgi:serine/threonine-protein kinase HipA
MPTDVKPRIHALTLDETNDEASLDTAFSVAGAFGIRPDMARTIVAEVGAAVSGWRQMAERNGLTPAQIERMESAFEHADLEKAVAT